uniref:Uncharacterized protein n=1 Tax=Methanococcus maripaludis (strain C6 / ATCC BAA-1332) TaxID=444158 RepID=A9A6U8_METM6
MVDFRTSSEIDEEEADYQYQDDDIRRKNKRNIVRGFPRTFDDLKEILIYERIHVKRNNGVCWKWRVSRNDIEILNTRRKSKSKFRLYYRKDSKYMNLNPKKLPLKAVK